MPPKVSIIILNWNQPDLTVNCVNSILKQDFQDFDILLIDNNSEDDSMKMFNENFGNNEKIRIIKNYKNLGYAAGNNIGARVASGDYVIVQNNDTLVERGWLEELIKAIESDGNIAMVTSNIINLPSVDKINEYRLFSKRKGWRVTFLGYGIDIENEGKGGLIDIFAVNGCSFIYRRNLITEPFDPDYFIYAEETKLSWLMRLRGYDIKIAPKANVFHLRNITRKSNKKTDKYFTFLGERNKIMNWLTFYKIRTLIRLFPMYLIGLLILNFSDPKKAIPRVKGYFWILTHLDVIHKKRDEVQRQRRVSDEAITRYISCNFNDERAFKNKILRFLILILNKFFCFYFRIVGIKTVESN